MSRNQEYILVCIKKTTEETERPNICNELDQR